MGVITISEQYIVSKWILKYIQTYLNTTFNDFDKKVIIKIEYMPKEFMTTILDTLIETKQILDFELLVKVTETVTGYEQLLCKERETIVWFRNNIQANQAVILVLSNQLPEGQSLKDIVSIDESVLLSKQGLKVLKEMLKEEQLVQPFEFINDLMRFLDCYQEVTDVQLVAIAEFLLTVITSEKQGMNRIADALPALRLFRERELQLSNKQKIVTQLRKNYYMSTFRQSASKILDPRKIMESAQNFIQNEQIHSYPSDIWGLYQNNEQKLMHDVERFIYDNDGSLFYAYFSDIEQLFHFKEKRSLIDRLFKVKDTILSKYDEQVKDIQKIEERENIENEKIIAESRIIEAIEAVVAKDKPEIIKDFVEKYDTELENEGSIRQLKNLINKLENPSEYHDFLEAFSMEAMILLEQIPDHEFSGSYLFELVPSNVELETRFAEHLNFHLHALEKLTDFISVTLITEGTGNLPNNLHFELILKDKITKKIIESTNFTISCTKLTDDNNGFYNFAQMVAVNDFIGTIVEIDGQRRATGLHDDIELKRQHMVIAYPELVGHYEVLQEFLQNYSSMIADIIKGNYNKQTIMGLELLVSTFLDNVYANSNAVQHVYGYFNKIGVTEYRSNQDTIEKQIFSVLHPIRLLGYFSKFIRLNTLLQEFTNDQYGFNRLAAVSYKDNKLFKEYVESFLGEIPPSYVTTNEINGIYLLEEECFGEGTYILDSKTVQATEKTEVFVQELQKVVSNYLTVYPYAKNSMSVLFMYANNEEYIKRAIETILYKNNVEKLAISIYTEGNSATIYSNINKWIETREDLTVPMLHLGGLPKVELNILPKFGKGDLIDKIKASLNDYDIAFFMNFLTQSGNSKLQKDFFDLPIADCSLTSAEWVTYEELGYLSAQGGSRYINYIAKTLPTVFKRNCDLQYVLHKHSALTKRKNTQVLRGVISLANNQANRTYDALHDVFNWIVVYDKYIDPRIAKELSAKAQIIKYSVVRKANKEVKLLVSSSESINKLIQSAKDTNYNERLESRLRELLKVTEISGDIIQDMLSTITNLSGGLLLRSLGAGKFIHELLAMYLTLKAGRTEDVDTIVVWASCDELEWFRSKQKRPDLLKIEIVPNVETKEFDICFTLIELKLIHINSYEVESADALKQLDSGVKTLKKYLDYEDWELDRYIRLQSFYRYLMQARPYTEKELMYMENLKLGSSWTINKTFKKQADIYVYSHNDNFIDKEEIERGHYQGSTGINEIQNVFTRGYILKSIQIHDVMQADEEVKEPVLEKFDSHLKKVAASIGLRLETDEDLNPEINGENEQQIVKQIEGDFKESVEILDRSLEDEYKIESEISRVSTIVVDKDETLLEESKKIYPEIIALKDIELQLIDPVKQEVIDKDIDNKKFYLEQQFGRNGVHLTVKDKILGANIIRFICQIPPTQTFNSVKGKAEEIKLWLRLRDTPNIFVNKDIIIDINREKPDVIYYPEFMKLVREQVSLEKIENGTILPIGLSPLKEVMYMNMLDSPHLLVAGTTGSGKSVSLNAMIFSMMCLYDKEDIRFVFIDPKQVEFVMYKGIQHTEEVITQLGEAVAYLEKLTVLMDDRYTILSEAGMKNLHRYNQRCIRNNELNRRMHRIIVVFDEFADFMLQEKELVDRMKDAITRLGQKARAAGIHLIICTQSPKANIIDTNIRNNIISRLCLKVADSTASQVVIDEPGAEKLGGRGDYLLKNEGRIERGMSPFLDEDTQDLLIQYFHI